MAMLPPDPLYIFKSDMGPVLCLMFREVNKVPLLYAGALSGRVHVWNLKSVREVGILKSSNESCISINHYGGTSEVITQDKAGVIRFWIEQDLNWTLVKEVVTDYYGFCKTVLFDDIIYIPLKNGSIKSVSVKQKENQDNLSFIETGTRNEVTCFRIFNAYNETLALIAFESCEICLYSLMNKKKLSDFRVDECPMALDFNDLSMTGVCGCPTESLYVFNINSNLEIKLRKTIILKNPGVASVAIRPDNKVIGVGCWDGKLRLYSMKSLSILVVLDTHLSTIQDLLFMTIPIEEEKFKYHLAAGSKDSKISLWDLYNK